MASQPQSPIAGTATVLLSSFMVVSLGYVSRRSGMLPPLATGAISTVVGTSTSDQRTACCAC